MENLGGSKAGRRGGHNVPSPPALPELVTRMNGATRFPLSLPGQREPTAKGTGLGHAAGKVDPVELDSSEIEAFVMMPQRGGEPCKTTGICSERVRYLMGSLAGAARLLNYNAVVQR